MLGAAGVAGACPASRVLVQARCSGHQTQKGACNALIQRSHVGHGRRSPAAAPVGRSSRLRCSAIGFELGGPEGNSKTAERHAEELSRSAASLLLYSSVLKGKPAQAFLGVLQLLQKGNPLLLVQQYGEMYRHLAAEDYASWQDWLLDQVIRGSDSALARAAAAGKPTAHLRAAAAHDLDVLQQLAVLESTLARWVKDTAYGTTDRWLEAASSLGPAQAAGGSSEGGSAAVPVPDALMSRAEPPAALLAPLSQAQRAALRAELAGKWRWSEGIELLERYHAVHGYGLVSQHSVLTWTGKLQAQDVLKGAHELAAAEEEGLVTPHHHAAEALHEALAEFLGRDLAAARCPRHVAVCGNAADRWLYTCWALQRLNQESTFSERRLQEAAGGLRTLVLPASQLSSLPDLAWSLSQHPRTRFAVVVNSMGSGGLAAGDAAAMLSGYDGFSWPSNALLIAGFSGQPPEELAPAFKRITSVEDRLAA